MTWFNTSAYLGEKGWQLRGDIHLKDNGTVACDYCYHELYSGTVGPGIHFCEYSGTYRDKEMMERMCTHAQLLMDLVVTTPSIKTITGQLVKSKRRLLDKLDYPFVIPKEDYDSTLELVDALRELYHHR